jgi:catechol 2,3-dioxygenase-like lactoylglutathione lyase family enzyme
LEICVNRGPDFRHHHVGVAVQHMSEGLAWYRDALGLSLVAGPVDDLNQRVTVALLQERTTPALLELVAPLSAESPVSRYALSGSAAYHLCYEVADVMEAVRWLTARKCLLVSGPFPAPAFENRPLAWMYSPTRHLIELLQHV